MRELRLEAGPLEAVILPEAGARLHRLRAFGHDLLRTPDHPAAHARDPFFWGAYVMAPWCNRIAAAPVTVGSRVVDVPSNFPEGTAIHGQVYARPWTVDADGVACRCRAGGDDWPWTYEVSLRPRLDDAGLQVDLRLANRSEEPMPAGLGLHPWWRRPVEIAFRAGSVYPSNVDPPARPVPAVDAWDESRLGLPAAGLDATWTELAAPTVDLVWPELEVAATLALSRSASHVVMATPADSDATALEVQTHAPDGLRRLLAGDPGALRWLAPGAELRLELSLAVRRC
jgi:aldose 1-epimerase